MAAGAGAHEARRTRRRAGKLGLSFDGEKLDLAATVGEMAKKFDLEDDDMLDVLL